MTYATASQVITRAQLVARPRHDAHAEEERKMDALAREYRIATRRRPGRCNNPADSPEKNQQRRSRCNLCAYDVANPTQLRASGYGDQLQDIAANQRTAKHQRNQEVSRGRMAMLEKMSYDEVTLLPLVPNMLYRCICCSLDKEGTTINRYTQMMPSCWSQHVLTPDHQRRALDSRLGTYRLNHPGGVALPEDVW